MRYQPNGGELKYFDDTAQYINAPLGLASIVDAIDNIAQGTQPFERIGRSVVIRYVDIKINLQCQWAISAAVLLPAAVSYRIDLILDKQANGVNATGNDIYDTVAASAATNRFSNLYNSDRFVFLKRWEGDMNPPSFGTVSAGLATNVFTNRDLKMSKKCAIKMEFSGTTGATAEIRSNHLMLVYSFDTAQPGNVQVNIDTANCRLRFGDL